MKKLLKFSGICAAVIALVGFILLMTTPILELHGDNGWAIVGGGVFGGGTFKSQLGGYIVEHAADSKLAWTGLIGWILMLVAILILIAGFVLPLLKINTLEKFAGILNLVAVISLVVAGILVFVSAPVFQHANGAEVGGEWQDAYTNYTLGVGWIFAGILAIVGGCLAILPAAVDFIGSKKK